MMKKKIRPTYANPFGFRPNPRNLTASGLSATESRRKVAINAFHRYGVNIRTVDGTSRRRLPNMDGEYRESL